jgi:hypothetical protein
MAKSTKPLDENQDPIMDGDAPIQEAESTLKKFECWQAAPVFKFRVNEDTGEQERYLSEVKKKGAEPLFTTHIEQHHADTLNEQLENSGQYYFAV